MKPNEPEFYTTSELCKRWRIQSVTLHRWRKSGKIKALCFGDGVRTVRFPKSEVERIEAATKTQED